MIVFAVVLALRNASIEKKAQIYSDEALIKLDPELNERKTKLAAESKNSKHYVPDYVLAPDMSMPVETIDGVSYIGTVDIPSLNIHLPVQSELDDSRMRKTPCRMEGTVYNRDIIIGAHCFKIHFGYINRLEAGDTVTFTDIEGNQFDYSVLYSEELLPNQLDQLKSGDWDMTLFTCTVGGRSRIVVRLELVE